MEEAEESNEARLEEKKAPSNSSVAPEIQAIINAQIQNIQSDPNVPQLYVNGFTVMNTLTDFRLILTRNDKAVVHLTFSHSTIKSLVGIVSNTLTDFEQKTKSNIQTLEELIKNLADGN